MAAGRVSGLVAPGPPPPFFSPNQFVADNGDLRRCSNTQPHPVALHRHDGYPPRAPGDDDPLAAFPTEDEHGNPSWNDSPLAVTFGPVTLFKHGFARRPGCRSGQP